jgi:hypothetical protein
VPDIRVPPPPLSTQDQGVWSTWYVRVKDAINQLRDNLSWTSLSFVGSNITDILTRNHNDLQNIQGGGSTERYHLTLASHTDLTDGGATILHKHDHNLQDGLQGGTTDEYYHLSLDDYDNLGGGGGSGRVRKGTDTTDDIVIDSTTAGLVLLDTDGHYWRVKINTSGVLTTTDLGTTKP